MDQSHFKFYVFVLAGKMNDPTFHKCHQALKFLESDNPKTVRIEAVYSFFETQWEEYLRKIQSEKKGSFFNHKQSPLVYFNDNCYIGDADAFQDWALNPKQKQVVI